MNTVFSFKDKTKFDTSLQHFALLAPNEGELLLLARALNKTASDNVILHLFTDDITPGETATVASFTEPGDGFGYASASMTAGDWTMRDSGGVSLASGTQQTYTFTSGTVAVYGYFFTDGGGNDVLWCERFSDAPYNIPSGGGTINVTPKIQLD